MKSVALILAKREFMSRLQSRHVFALLIAYVLISVGYGWFSYISFVAALHPPQIPGNPTIIGATFPPPKMSLLINLANVHSLGALVALAISFDCLSSERVSRSLVLLLSLPISRHSVLNGKLLGVASLILPIGTVIPVGAIAVSLSLQGELTLAIAPRLVMLGVLIALYLLLWATFAVFASSLIPHPAGSLALCFAVWIIFQSGFIGTLLPALVAAVFFPGQPVTSLATGSNLHFFNLDAVVARLIPPFSFLHATYGYYQFTNFYTIPGLLFSYSNYVLNTSVPFFKWISFAWGDFAVLIVSVALLVVSAHFLLRRSDIG